MVRNRMRLARRTFLAAAAATPLARRARAGRPPLDQPYRQVHLDFHTSELVPDVGADFDAAEFVATLSAARVKSANVFAKCHHGYAYYDSKVATKHPALEKDMLGDMVRGLRGAGIAVNYYYSLCWDVLTARRHPEWRQRDRAGAPLLKNGAPETKEPTTLWPQLCLNSPFIDQVVRENDEILQRFDVDGAWFDILKTPPDGCFCKWCVEDRKRLRLGDTPGDLFKHGKIVAKRVEKRLHDLVQARRPGIAVFFNSRIVIGVRDELAWYSHLELESLPTGGWGYTHFQQRVRYLRTLGKQLVGMTGRFHRSWGDFGGLKNQAALDFECLNFLANGCRASVGDQLHPRGRLDPTTYKLIGNTFAKVEALEPWARDTEAVADIGVLSTAAVLPDLSTTKVPVVDQGFTNMLVELHHQFDVLDTESDFRRYQVLVLPDVVPPLPALVAKVRAYLRGGGKLLLSHKSLLDEGARRFVLDDLGVDYQGPSKFRDEFMVIEAGAFPAVDPGAYFLYQRGLSVAARPGTEVLASYGHPYFDRAPEHFVSHAQTPLGQRTREPLVTRKGNVAYVAHPIFTSYALDAFGVSKRVVAGLLDRLLPRPALRAHIPSTAQATVLTQRQGGGRRTIVHLLHYPLTRRAPDLDVIEEPGLLADVAVELRAERAPAKVTLVPDGTPLPFEHRDGYVRFRVPRVLGHQAIAVG
jgi:hypothetical protein